MCFLGFLALGRLLRRFRRQIGHREENMLLIPRGWHDLSLWSVILGIIEGNFSSIPKKKGEFWLAGVFSGYIQKNLLLIPKRSHN